MKRISYRPYFFLGAFFIALFGASDSLVSSLRHGVVAQIAPLWSLLASTEEVGTQEDLWLQAQLEGMHAWILSEHHIAQEVGSLQTLLGKKPTTQALIEEKQIRAEMLLEHIRLHTSSVMAPIVFREPAFWSSFVWIGVGEKDNALLKKRVIAKNSPVVIGHALIGVVEEVGVSRSKVRLITDRHLCPSVQVARGQPQNQMLLEHLEALELGLLGREDLYPTDSESLRFFHTLKSRLQQELSQACTSLGIVQGSSDPLWRSCGQKLKGLGFYQKNFRDDPHHASAKIGDLLVTTGLDGVFPAGLRVGIVSQVEPLREGATSYTLEVTPCGGSFDHLRYVFVLPPQDYPKHDG